MCVVGGVGNIWWDSGAYGADAAVVQLGEGIAGVGGVEVVSVCGAVG